jgi:hypothetical protein
VDGCSAIACSSEEEDIEAESERVDNGVGEGCGEVDGVVGRGEEKGWEWKCAQSVGEVRNYICLSFDD